MYEQLDPARKEWVDRTFDALSENEKIGQMVNEHAGHFAAQSLSCEAYLERYPVGSLFVGAEIIDTTAARHEAVKAFSEKVRGQTRVPLLFSGDFEHGIGAQISGFSHFPSLMAISSTFRPEDGSKLGEIIAREGAYLDIRWAFGPVADLNLAKENPVTGIRSAGDRPEHVLPLLKNIVRGMQRHGVAACPKHFPGDGTDSRNQHIVTSLNLLDRAAWDRLHGRVFRELIEDGAMSIMIGHLGFPAAEPVDPVKRIFRPATASRRLMTGLLREELGFRGVIVTDALSMCGYQSWGSYEERILDTFNGGADVFLWPETERFFPLLRAALRDGRASRERLDESVRRILSFKTLLNCHLPHVPPAPERLPGLLASGNAAAEEIGEHSITLLRNHRNVIPWQLPPQAKILILTMPDTPANHQCCATLYYELTARDYQVTYTGFGKFYAAAAVVDGYDAVMLVYCGNTASNDYALWNFVNTPGMKRLTYVSVRWPYFLYEVANADTYVNCCSDSTSSLKNLVRGLLGEIPMLGRSPVGLPHCFDFGDGQ